jgi:AcrR family transcriptional regulator
MLVGSKKAQDGNRQLSLTFEEIEKTMVKSERAVPTRRRRTSQGEQTRQTILQTAVDIASAEGLEGLSLGRLAAELGMSKSGLFAHFGSKEELQLATIETALAIFSAQVIQPAQSTPPGMARLQALCDAWLSYMERENFRGGCFIAAVTAEFDSRPGAVRDRIAELMNQWFEILGQFIREAQELGELDSNVDTTQLAFEIHALMWGANWMLQLHSDRQAITRAKTAISHRLQSVTTK